MNTATVQDLGVPSYVPKQEDTELSENDIRYAFIPIWESKRDIHPHTFYSPDLPANEFFPLKPFQVPKLNLEKDEAPSMLNRSAYAQVLDLFEIAGGNFAVEFIEVAKLRDGKLADKVFSALQPQEFIDGVSEPKNCTKYSAQLKNKCATCWIQYLEEEAEEVLELYFAISDSDNQTARETKQKALLAGQASRNVLLGSLQSALALADSHWQESVSEIESKTKKKLSPQDLINMRHLHNDRPNFSMLNVSGNAPQIDSEAIGAGFAKGMQTANQPNTDDLSQVIADSVTTAVQQATAPLITQINEQQEIINELTKPTSYSIGDEVSYKGEDAKVKAKPFGKYTITLENGEEIKSVPFEELG